ncbi:MAG: hypothetical protein J2P54_15665 [Bradyrhizobiaceae bacterium]|nr:hypothetical protein [Bradyrhizobiaceae bacterium]
MSYEEERARKKVDARAEALRRLDEIAKEAAEEAKEPYEKEVEQIDLETSPLVDVVAENMANYAGALNLDLFKEEAEKLIRRFEEIEGHAPADYLEIGAWALF